MRSTRMLNATSTRRMLGVLVVVFACFCATFAIAPSAFAARRIPAPAGIHVAKVTATTASLDWRSYTGAKSYRVKYSAYRSMTHPHYRTFKASKGRLTGLRSNHRYYFRVRVPHTRSGFVPSHYSIKRTFRTHARGAQTPPGVPSPPSPTGGSMKYGVSATNGNFAQGYDTQMKKLDARVGYLYGQDPRGKQFADVPENQDLWIQTKATTRAQYDAMLASFPKHRTGKVFLHYFNEPEDQIANGDMTMKQWQDRTDALYAAIDAAHLSYVKKSVEVMYYTLQQSNHGTSDRSRQLSNYLRPGVQQVGFSAYAEKKMKNGHEVAGTDPVQMPASLRTWSNKTGLPFSVITGWAVGTNLLHDPTTLRNRQNWLAELAPNLAKAGADHLMWFDIPWSNGDYRIETDPGLMKVWQGLAGS